MKPFFRFFAKNHIFAIIFSLMLVLLGLNKAVQFSFTRVSSYSGSVYEY